MKKHIAENIVGAMSVPSDVIMNIPRITLSGSGEVYIENHKGILAYTSQKIRVSSAVGPVCINGNKLKIIGIRLEDILINGEIMSIEYEKLKKEVKNV